MKKYIGLLFAFISFQVLYAQDTGVHFEQQLSWEQIKAKAKQENKYIFLDCYASWCGPCKMMDHTVYPDTKVGEEMNAKFISFKIQMDSAGSDAQEIMRLYRIMAYPSFLFFSPDGNLVHQAAGYYPAENFISITRAAMDPDQQYYTLLAAYKNHSIKPESLQQLAMDATALNNKALADSVGAEYIRILLSNPAQTKENVEFVANFTSGTKEPGFTFLKNNSTDIDSLMGIPFYTRDAMDQIITKEEVNGPDLGKCQKTITRKYDAVTADRIITRVKIFQYYGKDWPAFTAALTHYTDMYEDNSNAVILGGNAVYILQNSKDKSELVRAMMWCQHASQIDPANEGYKKTSNEIIEKLKQ